MFYDCIPGGCVDMFHVAEEHVILGIFINMFYNCIPGGRVDTFHVAEEYVISVILIKHVL